MVVCDVSTKQLGRPQLFLTVICVRVSILASAHFLGRCKLPPAFSLWSCWTLAASPFEGGPAFKAAQRDQ